MFRKLSRVAVALVPVAASVLLAGCGGSSNGAAETSPSAAPSSEAGDSLLKVSAPLSADGLIDNPCSALGDSQLTDIGLLTNGQATADSPKLCRWKSSSNELNSISLSAVPQNKGGISDIYAQKAQSAYFEPVSISGYPGVYASISSGPNKTDPCPIAKKVGDGVVAHLRGGA
ncbi:DUF3558 domain-containing protein [Amycolatopsis saalfeldensis]|uniref:DUF3558 domain-containing protein n=1 Tax=Amycolatopsis saalfeldensis TaxID=394193 RepID=A0A1H8YRB1_9PSEU|nr:DUF3558 domain-containing protein [Amycolatopsis saalfeldensis]SEP54592.1 Protein of unknown function [Amycolatopsis saalfeldensis]